jgi:putative acetyltransferase
VHAINKVAFVPHTPLEKELGQSAEAGIVDSIRSACPDVVSLVPVDAGRIVGHIFFCPVFVSTAGGAVQGMGLAPMAVIPERQLQGIGYLLAQAGIDAIRERGCPFAIVLGHPEYYPRFGFVPASQYGLSCQWDGGLDSSL